MKSMNEIYRVLKPGGLCYVNFMTTNCTWFQKNKSFSIKGVEGELYLEEGDEVVLHTFLTRLEVEELFKEYELIKKLTTSIETPHNDVYEEIHIYSKKPKN